VRETLKPSQNLYAQLLLLQVGANAGRPADENADRKSVSAIFKSQIRNLKWQADLSSWNCSSACRPGDCGQDKTTEEISVELMNDFLAQVGVKKGDVLLEEGSGLSRPRRDHSRGDGRFVELHEPQPLGRGI